MKKIYIKNSLFAMLFALLCTGNVWSVTMTCTKVKNITGKDAMDTITVRASGSGNDDLKYYVNTFLLDRLHLDKGTCGKDEPTRFKALKNIQGYDQDNLWTLDYQKTDGDGSMTWNITRQSGPTINTAEYRCTSDEGSCVVT